MRLVPHVAAVTVMLGLLAACADSPVVPAEEGSTLLETDRTAELLAELGDLELERPRLDATGLEDVRTILSVDLLTPESARNIGTGSAILITIPDEGRFGCTANFIWGARGRLYLGSAGHCFLPGDRTSTHGAGADYDASGVVVEVCVEDCEGNFNTNQLLGTWVTLGPVAYARQASETGAAVGHDFGVVEIPRQLNELVRPSMPVWGGPTGVHAMSTGDTACHYGHGVGFGEVVLTKARVGVGGSSDHEAWAGDFAAAFGDSGSGLVACDPVLLTFQGHGAIGVLTHLGVRLDPSTGEHGVVLGTTIARSVEMAREANLRLRLVLE